MAILSLLFKFIHKTQATKVGRRQILQGGALLILCVLVGACQGKFPAYHHEKQYKTFRQQAEASETELIRVGLEFQSNVSASNGAKQPSNFSWNQRTLAAYLDTVAEDYKPATLSTLDQWYATNCASAMNWFKRWPAQEVEKDVLFKKCTLVQTTLTKLKALL